MAKIKYSALVSDMRNKLNGSVLSKNRYGSYVRNKVTPVNPQTSYQQIQRGNLSAISSLWRGLTELQRQAWTALAQSSPSTDIFGDTKTLAGNAYFVSLNLNLMKAGGAVISDAPRLLSVPSVAMTSLNSVKSAGNEYQLSFAVDGSLIPVGFKLAVYATPPVSAGVSFVKNLYRYLGVYIPTAGVVYISDDYVERFGVPSEGSKVFVRVACVSLTSGELGLPTGESTITSEV